MNWFPGEISEAVLKVKSSQSTLLVLVKGTDENSEAVETILNSEEVTEQCKNFICLSLEASSTAAAQFSAIYPVILVPSVYLINADGVPVDVIFGEVNQQALLEKLASVSNKAHGAKEGDTSQTTSSSPGAEVSGQTGQEAEGAEGGSVDLDTRVQRARELLEAKRAAEAQKKFDEDRQKEVERRDTGKKMSDLKQAQKERENAELKADLQRQRREEKEARDKVKRQIEEDRQERARRYQTHTAEEDTVREKKRTDKLRVEQAAAAAQDSSRQSTARLQFRMTDGRSITQQFSADETLATARQFVRDNAPPELLGSRPSEFRLGQLYPKRTFTASESSSTLRELGLSPSAALVVLPSTRTGAAGDTGSSSGLLALLLAPFLFVWALLVNLFSSQRSLPAASAAPSGGSSTPVDAPRSDGVRRRGGVRMEGNTARLTNENEDDDDENARWNGNSTQQM